LKISVALCTYNGARFLNDQLASLAAQQRQPDELVVFDDCSTDNTMELLEKFSAPFPVRLHSNNCRIGSTANFELAIAACEGELIALCDQDDIWTPEKLTVIERRFIDNPDTALVFTDAEIIDDQAKPTGATLWESIHFDHAAQQKIRSKDACELLSQRPVVTGATMTFRASFRDLVLPIPRDIPLIHDGWIALMISLAGRLDPIAQPLIKYRQHDDQQLGVRIDETPAPDFMTKVKHHYGYTAELQKLEAITQRVLSQLDRYKFTHQDYFAERLKHVRRRVAIAERKLNNIPAALAELFTGRYHRYSQGFSSLFKDLVR
jgi:hypothetical protein